MSFLGWEMPSPLSWNLVVSFFAQGLAHPQLLDSASALAEPAAVAAVGYSAEHEVLSVPERKASKDQLALVSSPPWIGQILHSAEQFVLPFRPHGRPRRTTQPPSLRAVVLLGGKHASQPGGYKLEKKKHSDFVAVSPATSVKKE